MFVYWIHLPEQSDVASQGYVGITDNFEQRMFAHKSCAKSGKNEILYKAIRKYGWNLLIKEIIVIGDEEYCKNLERKLRPKPRIAWNIAIGGESGGGHFAGIKQSFEHVQARKNALIGREPGFYGKSHTDDAKQKIRIAHIGKQLTEQAKQKISIKKSKRIKINGIIYSSRQEASRQTKIPTGSFSYLIKNKPSSTKWDWLWQIEDVV